MPHDFNKITLSLAFLSVAMTVPVRAADKDKIADPGVKSAQGTLWVNPVDIQTRDLFLWSGRPRNMSRVELNSPLSMRIWMVRIPNTT